MTVMLNAHARSMIEQAILNYSFKAEQEELNKRELALGQELYDYLYPREIQSKMNSLPPEFFTHQDNFRVNYRVEPTEINRKQWQNRLLRIGSSRPVSTREAHTRYEGHDITKLGDLGKVITQFCVDAYAFDDKYERACAGIRVTLKNMRTLAVVKRTWPEITTIVDKLGFVETAAAGKAIAPQLQKLNEVLGLPPKE